MMFRKLCMPALGSIALFHPFNDTEYLTATLGIGRGTAGRRTGRRGLSADMRLWE